MKTRFRLFVSMLFIVPLVASVTTVFVNAQDSSSGTNSTSSTDTDTEKPDDKDLLIRLSEEKATLKLKLTTIEQDRLKLKCKMAQTGGVSSLAGRIKGIETSRKEVYGNLLDRLNKLVEKLKVKNVDTTTLESEIATLKTKIDTFNTDLATYKLDVKDLKSLDCVSDPTAFKASLETGRTDRAKVANDSADIKAYVNDTIKPTLKDIRAKLAAQESTSSSTGGNQ